MREDAAVEPVWASGWMPPPEIRSPHVEFAAKQGATTLFQALIFAVSVVRAGHRFRRAPV